MVISRRLSLRHSKSLWSYNPIPTGCVLYLPLWSPGLRGGAFKSIDPFGRITTVSGSTKVADGFSLDGTSSDRIVIPHHSSLDAISGVTVIAWIYKNGNKDYAGLVEKGAGDNTDGWLLRQWESGNVQFDIRTATVAKRATTASAVSTGAWHFYAGVFNKVNVLLFVDEVKTTGDAKTDNFGANANQLTIGQDISDAANRSTNGIFGEVGVWERALSDNEVEYYRSRTKDTYL